MEKNQVNQVKSATKIGVSQIAIYATLLLLSNFVLAQTAGGQLTQALKTICTSFETLLPVMAFVLFILAGVAYAAGQFFGAETRAKAVGYSMNMLTGAIIALVLSILAPTIITALLPAGQTAINTGVTGCAAIN